MKIIPIVRTVGAILASTIVSNKMSLHEAVKEKYRHVIRYLLEHGVCVNVKDGNGDTPLHHAAYDSQSMDIVKLLLQYGADPSVLDLQGHTPWDLASFSANTEIVNLLEEYSQTHESIKDSITSESLSKAIEMGSISLVKFLLQAGVSPTEKHWDLAKSRIRNI